MIEDDKRNRSGFYQTGTKGSVPPLVTTNFITQDQGEICVCVGFISVLSVVSADCPTVFVPL